MVACLPEQRGRCGLTSVVCLGIRETLLTADLLLKPHKMQGSVQETRVKGRTRELFHVGALVFCVDPAGHLQVLPGQLHVVPVAILLLILPLPIRLAIVALPDFLT